MWALKRNQEEDNKKELDRLVRVAKSEMAKIEKERKKTRQGMIDMCNLLNEFRELSVIYGEVVSVALSQEARIAALEETTDYIDMVRGKVFPMHPKQNGVDERLNYNLLRMGEMLSRLESLSKTMDMIEEEVMEDATDDNGRDHIQCE